MNVDPRTADALAELWRLYPHLYAQRMSGGKWKPYRYLEHLSYVIHNAVFSGKGRVIVQAPPRHGKSKLLSQWVPIWYLDLMPERSVILTSYEADFAAHWGREVRNEIHSNAEIVVGVSEDSSAANRWTTPSGGGMVTSGIGGPITGRGGHLLIVDDPIKNWQQATSATYRQTCKDWFNSTLYTRQEPGACVIVIMTRWHEDDLVGWLLREQGDKWVNVRLPAIAEAADSMGRVEGEPLCPERYNLTALTGEDGKGGIRKAVGPLVWNGLYQQNPSSLKGDIVERAWMQKYWRTVPPGCVYAQSWDMAFKDGVKSSPVVGQVWARKGAEFYLVDQVRERMDFNTTLKAVRDLSIKWPQCRAKVVEDKANGPAVINALSKEIPGLIPYSPRGSKLARLAAVSPFYSAGNVFLPDPTIFPWVVDYVNELAAAPNAPMMDQADASSQILDHWAGGHLTTVAPAGVERTSPIPH